MICLSLPILQLFMISEQDNCITWILLFSLRFQLYISISANDKILEITWNSPFFSEKSTKKCKGHGIFADELLLAPDEVEFLSNLDYICRWKPFVADSLKHDPRTIMWTQSIPTRLEYISSSMAVSIRVGIRNTSSPLIMLESVLCTLV